MMRKLFTILMIMIISVFLIMTLSYFFFFQKINIDSHISNSKEIKNLNKKIFWSLGYPKQSEISTDYTCEINANDTVIYIFNAYLSPKFKSIGTLELATSTGYGGNKVNIYKIGNRFRVDINDYSDNIVEKDINKGYKILSKNLILDKENYKKNDSIFGRIQIKFLNKNTNLINESSGFFKGKLQ